MKMKLQVLQLCFLMVIALGNQASSQASTLASATYDTDSYIFGGFNASGATGITTGADLSGGNAFVEGLRHFNFGVIKFDDLTGIMTEANGGGKKYLTVATPQVGAAEIAVSVAAGDVETDYFGALGDAGPFGSNSQARIEWYFDNIKGDDASFGGYVGGAEHVGVLSVNAQQSYSLDVTSVVDDWIDNPASNYGFGLWAVSSSGGQGTPIDLASSENASFSGPLLTSVPVPEPSSLLLGVMAALGLTARRGRIASMF